MSLAVNDRNRKRRLSCTSTCIQQHDAGAIPLRLGVLGDADIVWDLAIFFQYWCKVQIGTKPTVMPALGVSRRDLPGLQRFSAIIAFDHSSVS